ncbi:hypothetical protein D3C75_983660 [compost metagenome]
MLDGSLAGTYGDSLTLADHAAVHTADGDTAHIFVIIHQCDKELERISYTFGRSRGTAHNGFIDGFHVGLLIVGGKG